MKEAKCYIDKEIRNPTKGISKMGITLKAAEYTKQQEEQTNDKIRLTPVATPVATPTVSKESTSTKTPTISSTPVSTKSESAPVTPKVIKSSNPVIVSNSSTPIQLRSASSTPITKSWADIEQQGEESNWEQGYELLRVDNLRIQQQERQKRERQKQVEARRQQQAEENINISESRLNKWIKSEQNPQKTPVQKPEDLLSILASKDKAILKKQRQERQRRQQYEKSLPKQSVPPIGTNIKESPMKTVFNQYKKKKQNSSEEYSIQADDRAKQEQAKRQQQQDQAKRQQQQAADKAKRQATEAQLSEIDITKLNAGLAKLETSLGGQIEFRQFKTIGDSNDMSSKLFYNEDRIYYLTNGANKSLGPIGAGTNAAIRNLNPNFFKFNDNSKVIFNPSGKYPEINDIINIVGQTIHHDFEWGPDSSAAQYYGMPAGSVILKTIPGNKKFDKVIEGVYHINGIDWNALNKDSRRKDVVPLISDYYDEIIKDILVKISVNPKPHCLVLQQIPGYNFGGSTETIVGMYNALIRNQEQIQKISNLKIILGFAKQISIPKPK
jgi:hypothetical protein